MGEDKLDNINNMDDMIQKLKDFQPDTNPKPLNSKHRLVIGIFGEAGVGKSSFVNSVLSLFFREGEADHAGVAPTDNQESHTICRNLFTLTNDMVLVDNRGFQDLDNDDVINEIQEQLDGNRGYTLKIRPGKISARLTREPVHVAIYVVSALGYNNRKITRGYKMIKKMRECQGRLPLAVITHVDCEEARTEDTKEYLNYLGIYNPSIFLVRNVTKDHKELEEKDKLSLIELLGKCTNEGNWGMAYKIARAEDLKDEAQQQIMQHDLTIPDVNLKENVLEPPQRRCIIL